MTELKPCPCGRVPQRLCIEDTSSYKYKMVNGDCCSYWSIEFRVNYSSDDHEIMELAIKAWNSAPRSK